MSRPFIVTNKVRVKINPTGEEGLIDIEKPDDISTDDMITRTDYVNSISVLAGNNPPVNNGFHLATKLTGEDGNPNVWVTEDDRASVGTHTDSLRRNGGDKVVEIFNTTSNSGQLDLDGNRFVIRKGKSSLIALSGEEILLQVGRDGDRSEFVNRVQQTLVQNNQFNSDAPFIADDAVINETDDNLAVARIQKAQGIHGPRRFPTIVQSVGKQDTLSLKELKKVGLLTMLHASGELSVPENPQGVEFISAHAPGFARVGQKVPISKFSAAEAYKQANPDFQKPSSTSFVDNGNILSHGNVNNYAATFAGFTSGPSIASATLLMLTVGSLLKALAIGFKRANDPVQNIGGSAEDRAKRLGNYRVKEEKLPNLGFTLGVVDTKNNFMAALSKGINVFFGLSETGNSFIDVSTPSALLGGATNIAKIHGYYNVVLRNVVKSATGFISPIVVSADNFQKDISGSGEDLATSLNPFVIAEKLNSSPLLSFLNILASIGDIAMEQDELETDGIASVIDLIPEFNRNSLNPAVLQAKNRLADGHMAWRQNSARSMFLLPAGVMSAARRYGNNKEGELLSVLASGDSNPADPTTGSGNVFVSSDSQISNGGRIKAKVLKEMEDYLEKDYMPFYFHDLRTNEIISFHAFLETVSDGFEASYAETEGFGRVDKVQVYKSTGRNISIGFKLVALDEDDFDQMWYKVNKLITLVYPQWSRGREIKWGTNRMIQPFSQQPSATPLVRMRLGDLFKSNYSKFAVARLFGISDDATKFNLERIAANNSTGQSTETQTQISTQIGVLRNARLLGEYPQGAILRVLPNGNTQTGYSRITGTTTAPGALLNQRGINRGSAARDRGLILNRQERATVVVGTSRGATQIQVQLISPRDGEDGVFVVPLSRVVPDAEDIQRTATRAVTRNSQDATTDTTTQQAMDSFLSEEDNPIFKAFATTKGKGLAGVIKSLKFDFNETTWSTDVLNGRAPMFIKIDIEFAPIHDVAPGIDHNGFMTAPIYNVGKAMQSISSDNPTETLTAETSFGASRSKLNVYRARRAGVIQ